VNADVLDRLRAAAKESHIVNGTSVALISDDLVGELADWSDPVQVRAERREGGFVDLVFRKIEASEAAEPIATEPLGTAAL
jgi:hypothetical protein